MLGNEENTTARCPACDGFKGPFGALGNGVCAKCHGKKRSLSSVLGAGTLEQESKCKECGGTGKCRTCGGTGELENGFDI